MDIIRSRRLPTYVLPAMLFLIGQISRLILNLPWSFGGVLFYVPLFAIGMFAFECQSRSLVQDAMSKPLFANFATAALLLGMVATETPNAISLPLFGIFFISVSCGNSLGGLLRSRGALVLGECSFGIYLLHGIVLDTLFVDAGALDELTTLALPLLLPIAAVALTLVTPAAYLLVERPAMRQGKALAHWLAGRHTKLDIRELDVAP